MRDNDDPSCPWYGPMELGADVGQVYAVTMIESNYGTPGNLEVIAAVGGQLSFLWRDSGPAFQWHGSFLLSSAILLKCSGR